MTSRPIHNILKIDRVAHDCLQITRDDNTEFIYTAEEQEIKRVMRLFKWLGVDVEDTYWKEFISEQITRDMRTKRK